MLRSPHQSLLSLESAVSEITGPVFGHTDLGPLDNDLILNYAKDGEPIGERILVHGHVLDETGRGRAERAGRVLAGQCRRALPAQRKMLSRAARSEFRRLRPRRSPMTAATITSAPSSPAPIPGANGVNGWRPAHIHFSVFGHAFAQRLITQMYFEGDPLIPICPILTTIPDKDALDRLVARARPQRQRRRSTRLPIASTSCCAARARPIFRNRRKETEPCAHQLNYLKETASQTAGPYVHIWLIPGIAGLDIFEKNFSNVLVTPSTEGERITLEGRVLDGTGSPLRDVLLEIWQANAAGRYNHPA